MGVGGNTIIYCADIETTGLLEDLRLQGDQAKLHNIGLKRVDKEEDLFVLNYDNSTKEEIQKFLDQKMYFIMHNGIGYDKKAFEILGFNVDNITFIDTLPISWYLEDGRLRYGLESYGEEFKVPKPKISSWQSLTQQDYDNRVTEDVKIQYALLKKQFSMMKELYGCKTLQEFVELPIVKLLNFKVEQLAEQEESGFVLDIKHTEESVRLFEEKLQEWDNQLLSVMPKKPIYKEKNRPKEKFLKKGGHTKAWVSWVELCKKEGIPENEMGVIDKIKYQDGFEEPNTGSSAQIKDWLFLLGWQPDEFKLSVRKSGEKVNVPQVTKDGELCQSVLDLAEEVPELNALKEKSIVAHRLGILKGFLETQKDGKVYAQSRGITNTLRFRHKKPITNLPSPQKPYGEIIRGCLGVKEGDALFGADLSGLESVLKLNFQKKYDPKFVEEQLCDDYDPHLAVCVEAGILSQEESDFYKIKKENFPETKYEQTKVLKALLDLNEESTSGKLKFITEQRKIGKVGNYACQYNAGANTVARSCKIDIKVARKVVKGYRDKNWSIQAIAKDLTVKKTSFGDFIYNPVSKLYYLLKNDKDRFSVLIQGLGAYILDIWLYNIFSLRKQRNILFSLVATFHDEFVASMKDEVKHEVEKIALEALDRVNRKINLSIPVKCSYDIGTKYKDIH